MVSLWTCSHKNMPAWFTCDPGEVQFQPVHLNALKLHQTTSQKWKIFTSRAIFLAKYITSIVQATAIYAQKKNIVNPSAPLFCTWPLMLLYLVHHNQAPCFNYFSTSMFLHFTTIVTQKRLPWGCPLSKMGACIVLALLTDIFYNIKYGKKKFFLSFNSLYSKN